MHLIVFKRQDHCHRNGSPWNCRKEDLKGSDAHFKALHGKKIRTCLFFSFGVMMDLFYPVRVASHSVHLCVMGLRLRAHLSCCCYVLICLALNCK